VVFEFRALCLLGRRSTLLAIPAVLDFFMVAILTRMRWNLSVVFFFPFLFFWDKSLTM
jgi:hypothetical protein